MPERKWLYTRRVLPLTDVKSRVVGWRCSQCNWTAPMSERCTGMAAGPDVQAAFHIHHCDEHVHQRDPSSRKRMS